MAQIIPFPFERTKKKKKDNQFTEKHILHMIRNIRENYPPSLWNTIYQLAKQGHLSKFLYENNCDIKFSNKKEVD